MQFLNFKTKFNAVVKVKYKSQGEFSGINIINVFVEVFLRPVNWQQSCDPHLRK